MCLYAFSAQTVTTSQRADVELDHGGSCRPEGHMQGRAVRACAHPLTKPAYFAATKADLGSIRGVSMRERAGLTANKETGLPGW